MSNRSRDKRKRKRRKLSPDVDDQIEDGGLPRPVRMLLENAHQLRDIAVGAETLVDVIANIDAAVRSKTERIVEIAAPYDAFDVLEHVLVHEVAHNPETYKETEHEGLAAVVELVALCLAARGHREGNGADDETPHLRSALEELIPTAREVVTLGSLGATMRAIETGGDMASLGLGAVVREIHVRNLSYPHMASDMVERLFDDPAVEADCRAVMGCTPGEMIKVFEALLNLQAESWGSRFEPMALAFAALADEFDRLAAEGVDVASMDPGLGGQVDGAVLDGVRAAIEAERDRPGAAADLDDDTVAHRSGLAPDVVRAVRKVASTVMAPADAVDLVADFFKGTSPFRTAPLLRAPDGSSMPVHSGLMLGAVREIAEGQLKAAGRWDAYSRRRGQFLEDEALRLLQDVFPMAEVHSGFKYFVPNPTSRTPETRPEDYTKLVEGDGLLVVDDVAIALEAKAGTFSAEARGGDARRLDRDLRKLVTDASMQADRTRERILSDGGLRLEGGAWLALDHVREVHTIALSLDDLSGIVTVTANLVDAGILGEVDHPWTVSLLDLRVITEVVDRPSELLLYIRRRTEPEVTIRFHAVDELDLFMLFLEGGLYFEPDPDRVAAELPLVSPARVRDRRRHRSQPRELLTSHTDPLDAWYAFSRGERSTPAIKPALNCDRGVAALVDALQSRGEPGWLGVGASLLDGDAPTQRKFGLYAQDLYRLTAGDGRSHEMGVAGGSRIAVSFFIVWASLGPEETEAEVRERLARYVTLKKYQLRVARGLGMLFDPNGDVVWTCFDNRPIAPDDELDKLMQRFPLRPPGTGQVTGRPRARTSGRVTPKKSR